MSKPQQSQLNIAINPRTLVSERRNPIEINYEVLDLLG